MQKINKAYFSTNFFLGRAMFLGVGFSYIFKYSGKDAYISIILGYLIGNVFIFIYDKISKNVDYNLNNFFSKQNIITYFYKAIFFLLYFYLIIYISIIFTNFVKVYYLFETPIWVTLILLLATAYYATLKNENTILRLSMILIPISLFITILSIIFLTPFLDLTDFLPIYTHDTINIFKGAFIFAIFSSVPNILLLEYKVNLKTKLYSYSLVFLVILIINLYITGVLGNFLITAYSYPEYMVLRKIKILDFIENVENFASIIWYFDAFILLTLSLSKLRNLFISKKKDIYLPILLLISVIVSFILFSRHFSFIATFFATGITILGIFLIITGPLLYIFTKKREN